MKTLRREGILPANIYGKGIKSQSIKLDRLEFSKVFKEAGETGLIELEVEKEKHPVLVHNVAYEPITDELLHVDFHEVNLKEKTTAQVPVEFIGESPAEKRGEGTLVKYIDELEVEALPTDLPEKFEVDVSGMEEVDATMQIKDIFYDKSKLEVKEDGEEIVAKIEPLRAEEEIAPPAAPAEGEEAPAEGEPAGEEKTEETREGEEPKDEENSDQ